MRCLSSAVVHSPGGRGRAVWTSPLPKPCQPLILCHTLDQGSLVEDLRGRSGLSGEDSLTLQSAPPLLKSEGSGPHCTALCTSRCPLPSVSGGLSRASCLFQSRELPAVLNAMGTETSTYWVARPGTTSELSAGDSDCGSFVKMSLSTAPFLWYRSWRVREDIYWVTQNLLTAEEKTTIPTHKNLPKDDGLDISHLKSPPSSQLSPNWQVSQNTVGDLIPQE